MFWSGSPGVVIVAVLISSVLAMMLVTRVLAAVESAAVTGSVIFRPLRRSLQSGVGLVFGSPVGGTNSRSVDGSGAGRPGLGVEDAALGVGETEAERGRVDRRGEVGRVRRLVCMAAPASQSQQLDRIDTAGRVAVRDLRAVRLAVGQRERLQEAVEMAVPDRGVVERREARQIDAVGDLRLHRRHGGGGEGARLLLDRAEDGLQGRDQLVLGLRIEDVVRRPPCSSACCPAWR